VLSSPLIWCIVAVLLGAACSATAAATRLTHPRLSAWLSAFAAALPADVTRMSPGAAPPKPPPADEVPTVRERAGKVE
jgi:hypothetical protein